MKRKNNRKIKIEKTLGRKLGDVSILQENRHTEGGLEDFVLGLLESSDKEKKAAGERLALMYDVLGLIISNEYNTREAVTMFGGGNGYHLDDQVREALLLSVEHLDVWKERGWIKSGGARVK